MNRSKARRRIEPGAKVPVAFTACERKLVIEHTFADLELVEALEAAPLAGGKYIAQYTLDELDELIGFVAAEANHAKTKTLEREWDALYDRLQHELESYDDGQQP
jgi:hypothetical protein